MACSCEPPPAALPLHGRPLGWAPAPLSHPCMAARWAGRPRPCMAARCAEGCLAGARHRPLPRGVPMGHADAGGQPGAARVVPLSALLAAPAPRPPPLGLLRIDLPPGRARMQVHLGGREQRLWLLHGAEGGGHRQGGFTVPGRAQGGRAPERAGGAGRAVPPTSSHCAPAHAQLRTSQPLLKGRGAAAGFWLSFASLQLSLVQCSSPRVAVPVGTCAADVKSQVVVIVKLVLSAHLRARILDYTDLPLPPGRRRDHGRRGEDGQAHQQAELAVQQAAALARLGAGKGRAPCGQAGRTGG